MPIFTEEAEPAYTRLIEAVEAIRRVSLHDLAALNALQPLRYAAKRLDGLCDDLEGHQAGGGKGESGSQSHD